MNKIRAFSLLLVVALFVPNLSNSEMYKWIDQDGAAHFTDDITNVPDEYRQNQGTKEYKAGTEPSLISQTVIDGENRSSGQHPIVGSWIVKNKPMEKSGLRFNPDGTGSAVRENNFFEGPIILQWKYIKNDTYEYMFTSGIDENSLMVPLKFKYDKVNDTISLHDGTVIFERVTSKNQPAKKVLPDIMPFHALEASKNLTYDELIEKGNKAESADEKLYYFKKALSLHPDAPEALAGRGGAYLRKSISGRDWLGTNGPIWKAIGLADINKALTINPSLPEALIQRAYSFNFQGKYDQAIDDFTKAIKLNPKEAKFYIGRADSYRSKKEYEKALSDCDMALSIDPVKAAGAYSAKARVYEGKKDYSAALAEYNKALTITPDSSGLYIGRASLNERNNHLDEAIADYSQAIKINPNNFRNYEYRAGLYRKKGAINLAEADEKKYLELNPDAQFELGLSNSYSDDAIIAYGKAIERNPWEAYLYVSRGEVWLYKLECDKAMTDFNSALDIDPELTVAYRWRGRTYAEKGDIKKTIADLKKECDLGQCEDYKRATQSISTLRGKVIASGTKNPVKGALIILKRHNKLGNRNFGRQYTITDQNGQFTMPPIDKDKPILPELMGNEVHDYVESVYHPDFLTPNSYISLEKPDNVIIEIAPLPSTLTGDRFPAMRFSGPGKISVRQEDYPLIVDFLKSWRKTVNNKQSLEKMINEFVGR